MEIVRYLESDDRHRYFSASGVLASELCRIDSIINDEAQILSE